MTRVTNFGRKRKYLEAGFDQTTHSEQPVSKPNAAADGQKGEPLHPKKKRQKTTKPKTDGGDDEAPDEAQRGTEGKKGRSSAGQMKSKTMKKHGAKSVAASGYKRRTEQRRLGRASNRQAETTCFACREKGHAAKDCPKAAGGDDDDQSKLNSIVGMCYRCGSTTHTLSRCKKPADPLNPYPFALCFVCSKKGHLASACPQNKEKGIYPNGGSCKLCGEKTHLAKDCELRKKDASGTAMTTVFGTGDGAGADEDDFHSFKRKNAEVLKDEKQEDRRRKRLDVKAGVHTGTMKAFGKNQVSLSKPKVVFF